MEPPRQAFQASIAPLWARLPPLTWHFAGVEPGEWRRRHQATLNYREVLREKVADRWYAALLSEEADQAGAIVGRFETWKGLLEFIVSEEALVEVWAYPEGEWGEARRIPATELAQRKQDRSDPPTFVTLTYRDGEQGRVVRRRLEFGFRAAERTLAASLAYRRHRELQTTAHEILSARDARGRLSAAAQWEALQRATQAGRLAPMTMPAEPASPQDLFVAFEFQVDEFNSYTRVARIYRESELKRSVVPSGPDQTVPVLLLQPAGTGRPREATGYRTRGLSDELEPVPHPIAGQDHVELRVQDPAEPDARRWNLLEFGEPELLQQSALAQFALVSAHLEKQRKELALKRSNLDLIAEPLFAALNVGGGLAGAGVPLGEAGRLLYNLTVSPRFIPRVPTAQELRGLFQLLAAKEQHPGLRLKPYDFLSEADVEALRKQAAQLSEEQVRDFLDRISDEDLKGMLRLARMQKLDAEITNLLGILGDAAKVTGLTESGVLREVFSNPYFSVTGEISLNYTLAAVVGAKVATPLSQYSLQDLSQGKGTASAWLQFVNFTVDVRAVLNTVSRLARRTLAEKELKQPFPYAPRLSDLAAYEIRIFGFPLLMFYKRGLLKADYAAYRDDYAYGVVGSRIVEHFSTREEMDGEIRAGRMFPLGYVRVPDGKGGWKETNLAVFAHRRRVGKKSKERTALVLYGLKAFEQHSQSVAREFDRFKAFEQALDQGGVIEQLVDAQDREALPPAAFEPILHVGPEAATGRYAPLLGALLEGRRLARREAWGLPISTEERTALARAKDALSAKGLRVDDLDGDSRLEVDAYFSQFTYWDHVEGAWRMIRLVNLPSRPDIERELAKAEEGQLVEQLWREAISPGGDGIVLINEARRVNDRYEIGPLVRSPGGELIGYGVHRGAKAVSAVFDQIDQLPVATRARLQFNHFASTVVELDADQNGHPEKVFVTVEFPPDQPVEREREDPLSGERHVLRFESGRLTRVVTDHRITEVDYDDQGVETHSRVHANLATRADPIPGQMLEETQTLEAWARDLSQPDADPHQPVLRKLRVGYVTGQVSAETYGLFPLPVRTEDDLHLTEYRFEDHGHLQSATAVSNGATDPGLERPRLEKVLRPVPGLPHFEYVAEPSPAAPSGAPEERVRNPQSTVVRRDVIRNLTKRLTYDHAHFGRLHAEAYTDRLNPHQAFDGVVTYEYRSDYGFGLVPWRTVKRHPQTGAVLSIVTTTGFDPATRRLTGFEVDYTGKSSVKVWDYRWENRAEEETRLRRTVFAYDRFEREVTGETTTRDTGEAVSRFHGRFEPTTGFWEVARDVWHRPGMFLRREVDVRAAFGKLVATRVGGEFESRPVYDEWGVEVGRQVWRRNAESGAFDRLEREEEDYHWQEGSRDARVRTYVEGQAYDVYRTITDDEGRTIMDAVKELAGLSLRTAVTFDGASERRERVEVLQNDQPRQVSRFLAETQQTDGTWLLAAETTLSWGLSVTHFRRLDDVLGRPVKVARENGETWRGVQWFAGTAIAKISELFDRQGRLIERVERRLNQGTEDGIPFDKEVRYRIDPWGNAGFAGEQAKVCGSDVAFFEVQPEGQVYFDLSQPYLAPSHAIDPAHNHGMPVRLKRGRASHVTAVFNSRFRDPTGGGDPGAKRERVLVVEKIDLRGLFYHPVSRRTLDVAGRILEESVARIPFLNPRDYSGDLLFQAAAQALPDRWFHYRYDPGWLTEETDPQTGGRVLRFTSSLPGSGRGRIPVNDSGWPDLATRVEAIRASLEPTEPRWIFRTLTAPRHLERNPFMPGQPNVWTAWTVTEQDPKGNRLYDSELIQDAGGEPSVVKANKTTRRGRPATRIAYRLAPIPSQALRDIQPEQGRCRVNLEAAGAQDCSRVDFLCFQVQNARDALLWVRDALGRQVQVGASGGGPGQLPFWPVDPARVRWVPDEVLPEHAAVLSARPASRNEGRWLALCVHDLAAAGIDIRRLVKFTLEVAGEAPGPVRVSPLYRLQHGRENVPDPGPSHLAYEVQTHASGLEGWLLHEPQRNEQEILAGLGVSAILEFDELPAAVVQNRSEGATYPEVMLLDGSAPDAAEPLYSLALTDGRFLELYRTLDLGDRYRCAVGDGFHVPKLDTFGAAFLEDEVAPGLRTYGGQSLVTVPLAKARSLPGRALANLKNRIAADVFKLAADQRLGRPEASEAAGQVLRRLSPPLTGDGESLAKSIEALPSLAQALLPKREAPWPTAQGPSPESSGVGGDDALRKLGRDQLLRTDASDPVAFKNSGLISTRPATAAERYVDTVDEAGLAMLAVKVHEPTLAQGILEFYWRRTRGGAESVHASYDAYTGASRRFDPLARRPLHSPATAGAQVAVADAAFGFWASTGNPLGFALGSNLVEQLLSGYRPKVEGPRGITEEPFMAMNQVQGLTLWPKPALYSVRSNARFYRLLKRLTDHEAEVRRFFAPDAWDRIATARNELGSWLTTQVLADVERTGVVPTRLFELQDPRQGTCSLAAERWTSAEDWLAFLEAADGLGVPTDTLQRWLEHLARVHGVQVNGVWGLDWTVALQRPDAIAPELTARFARVAQLLGHREAAGFALQALSALRTNGNWPVVSTGAKPDRPLPTGDGSWVPPRSDHRAWPESLLVFNELLAESPWQLAAFAQTATAAPPVGHEVERADLTVFLLITGAFYVSILAVALFWWAFRAGRLRWLIAQAAGQSRGSIVPEPVLQFAEERWATRVLGMVTPAGAPHSRFSNATVEQNFLMQLRAIHKLVVEWRRRENRWDETDPRIVSDAGDDWLNGLDEFCSLVGIYMRWVVKAGAKDGCAKPDPLAGSEDSNHIWSRLVLYFAEYQWALLTLVKSHGAAVTRPQKAGIGGQIVLLLNAMGLRQRADRFDARELFNFPANPDALDLLLVQQPGMTLLRLVNEVAPKLRVPARHLVRFIRKFKEFKRQERPDPIHPYLIEAGKLLPHFLLMGLGAVVFYNQFTVRDLSIVRYLWEEVAVRFAFAPDFRACGLLLLAGLMFSVGARGVRIYRWEATMLSRTKPEFLLDRSLTALVSRTSLVLPLARRGWAWNPQAYQWAGWVLRAVGFLWLGLLLLELPTPSFATFLVVKGLLAMLAFAEVAAIVLPAITTALSQFVQDRVSAPSGAGRWARRVNQLNLTSTRPTSLLWQSLRYHYRPSALSGSWWETVQAVGFYFALAIAFFGVGVFLCQEMLPLWFTEQYRLGADGKLLAGGVVFWCTMYLLRYGLFLMFTGLASGLATYPIKGTVSLLAVGFLLLQLLAPLWDLPLGEANRTAYPILIACLGLMFFEDPIRRALERMRQRQQSHRTRTARAEAELQRIKSAPQPVLGVVYMSGDELSYRKLTPDFLIARWRLLRDKLGSSATRLLGNAVNDPDDPTFRGWFASLHEAERRSDVTLWHPLQVVVAGETPRLPDEWSLNLRVETPEQRAQFLAAWQVRRWLVSMTSTAGYSQDTGINLVDIALRLDREGLGANTTFCLIQNKYDLSDANRPSQVPCDEGEWGQRNKLARLLCALAPGARAYNLHNWTPFGFKAGALTGTDLVPEVSLHLRTMLLLDRNATVLDLDALMEDLKQALTDPNVIIVIPGRSTTNTLTPVGQGSQMIEEGHRSFLKGLLSGLGGGASESLGTGWGNILAFFYGRVQRALLDPEFARMPLTSRMRRGASFRLRQEGLIGFGPHAVGISEDTWAVAQATHNTVALGGRPRFLLSRAMWHKIRETWSHAEWLTSFPRWAGGYLQMMQDPVMQQINDFGPLSVFSKEVRANSGRFYLSALITLFNILLMPLAIILDVTPFVQILIVLWNFGFVMNQILTVHGLQTYLESAGFYRIPALLGGVLTAIAVHAQPGREPFGPGLIALGFVGGGFVVGLGRWLGTRFRDVILFGPQLVLHALGQLVRQSLEFTVSGGAPGDAEAVNMAYRAWAGPREDKPLETFPNLINLKTVVWGVGLTSLALNLVALSGLDLLNVLMLLPSLLFSVSTLLSPFLMRPLTGPAMGNWSLLAKALGWGAGFCFYAVVSWLMAWGAGATVLATLLLAVPFLFMARHGLRFATYRWRVDRMKRELTGLLEASGTGSETGKSLAQQIMQQAASEAAKAQPSLDLRGLPAAAGMAIQGGVEQRLLRLLRAPTKPPATSSGWRSRFACESGRAFTLALFVLLWFFLVPVSDLFVVSAGPYRIPTSLQAVLGLVGGTIGIVLAASGMARLVQWIDARGLGRVGLERRLVDEFRSFQSQLHVPGGLTAQEVSSLYALFTDALLYFDQCGYGYARRALQRIESKFTGAAPVPVSRGVSETRAPG